MKSNSKIKAFAVSVKGPLHVQKNMPCQDVAKYKKGKNLVAVVSDGAGSAKYGKIGSRIVTETLCDLLVNADFKHIKTAITKAISIARDKLILHRLNKAKSEESLGDFSATIVGVVYHQNRGIFFHIGDGAGIALYNSLPVKTIISYPENGHFSCETFFYTLHDWKNKLRFTTFENADNLFLMSDGVSSFALSKDFGKIEEGFVLPINNFLMASTSKVKACKALCNTLNNERAQKLNSDDKTLLWIKL